MEKFDTHIGVDVPLQRSNADTDQIIPAVYLKHVTRTGFEGGLFSSWRSNESDFVLNRPEYAKGSVLVAGPDFDTGSSREHIVWALVDYGFRVVISSHFADIFRSNAGRAGLLAAQIQQSDAELLWKLLGANPGMGLTVNLETRTVEAGEQVFPSGVDDYTRWRLMEGFDDVSLTLRNEADIVAYEKSRPAHKPKTF